jgi:cytochrome c
MKVMRYVLAIPAILLTCTAVFGQGVASRGQRVFQACAACHSLEPNKNLTGPTLSGMYGRKAGSLPSFNRYSDALKSSGITWDDQTLDKWLADPKALVPGNEMPFVGIRNAQQRADLLAFLKEATKPGAPTAQAQGGGMSGMMMGGGRVPNLKKLDDEDRVQSVR